MAKQSLTMDELGTILLDMTSQSKLLTGVIASTVTGLLLLFGIGDPSHADTVTALISQGTGAIVTLISIGTALEALLFKHKAEVSSQHLLDTPLPQPTQPVDPITPPAQPAA